MSTAEACLVAEQSSLSDFFISYYYFCALPMIAAGVALMVYGGRHPTHALFVMTLSLVGTILLFVTSSWLPNVLPWWLIFFIMYFAYGNGAILAVGSMLSPRIGVTVCGAAFGFCAGVVLDLLIINRFVE